MEIISHLRVYDLEETLIASGYAMIEDYQEEIVLQQLNSLKGNAKESHPYRRALKLFALR